MVRFLKSQGVIKNLIAVAVLMAWGVFVGGYILDKQRLRFPFIDAEPLTLKAELSTAQAVTPGQGQTIRVAGVRIGDIGKIELVDGRAIVELIIDDEYRDVIKTDARALLRPKTGLKDMFLEVNPGKDSSPVARQGFTLPVGNTLPDVNPDEILAGLDADVRDHLRTLLANAAGGLDGRGEDLRAVLKRFEPTHRALAKVGTTVKVRRRELRRLISSLAEFNTELASRDQDLAEVVGESAKVFRALASEQTNVAATIRELPGALKATRLALTEADRLGRVLGPASDKLRPVPAALMRANKATTPFAREAEPLLRKDVRPFVREARPLVRSLRPAARDLAAAEPGVTRAIEVLNHFVNMLAHNPGGAEGPDKAGRQEGFLFHLAWVGHQSLNIFNQSDANGTFRPIVVSAPCNMLKATAASAGLAELALGLTGVLAPTGVCGEAGGVGATPPAKARKAAR